MQIQLIRSATLRIEYGQQKFVIDPYLAAKYTLPSYTGASRNPLVELPCSPEEVIAGIDMAIISHLHSDHFDPEGQRLLPSETSIFCQPGDESMLESKGFSNVTPVVDSLSWRGIKITSTTGQHGTGEVLKEMEDAAGFVFEAENEPTIYWVGDTILCEPVAEVISQVQPDIIITHSGGAVWGDNVLIIMNAEQTVEVCRAAPNSIVVATHMETLDHLTVSREALRACAEANGIQPEQLRIPADGERLAF